MKTETRIKVLAKCYVKAQKNNSDDSTLEALKEDIQALLDEVERKDPAKFDRLVIEVFKDIEGW